MGRRYKGGLIMFDLKKLQDNNCIFWVFMFPRIREVAEHHGWAIGVHGSVVHDLDLMAMPWVEWHSPADMLAKEIARVVDDLKREPIKTENEKPCNRVVYTIPAGASYIDLNVLKENKED